MQTSNNLPVEAPQGAPKHFSGYTLDELRYRRTFVLLQREFCKEQLQSHMRHLTDRNSAMYRGHDKPSSLLAPGSFLTRLTRGLGFADYIMFGMTAFTTVKKFVSFFKKKKR